MSLKVSTSGSIAMNKYRVNAVGPTGAPGPIGPTGPTGVPGPIGPTGERGKDGTSVSLKPDAESCQVIGDSYLDENGHLQMLDSLEPRHFKDCGVFRGPQGPTGEQGPTGQTGEGFAIYRTYRSIAEMVDDVDNVPEGKFVMITSTVEDPDNAKLYVRGSLYFTFVTDMSGAQGLTGPTGAQGPTGPTGPQGEQGPTGSTGPQGNEGPTGSPGEQGLEGPTGPTGPKGDDGLTTAIKLGSSGETYTQISGIIELPDYPQIPDFETDANVIQ